MGAYASLWEMKITHSPDDVSVKKVMEHEKWTFLYEMPVSAFCLPMDDKTRKDNFGGIVNTDEIILTCSQLKKAFGEVDYGFEPKEDCLYIIVEDF